MSSIDLRGSGGLRLDIYAAAYRGHDASESVLVGVEVSGLERNRRRGRRLRVSYALSGASVPERTTEVPLDAAEPRPEPGSIVRVLRRLAAPPGSYRLTVTVSDSQSARTAAVTHEVEVPAFGAAAPVIAVSGVMLTSSAVNGFTHADPADEEYRLQPILAQPPTARRVFAQDEKVEVLAEVYEQPVEFDFGGQMTVWTRVRDEAGNIVFDTNDIGASETFSDGRYGYQHWQLVPVRDLSPGNYVLQVGAQASDGMAEAWQSVPIMVVAPQPRQP